MAEVKPPTVSPENESIFNQYTIRAQRRDELQAYLKAKGIGTSVYYPLPLHLQPCFAYLGYQTGACPVSEQAAQEVLSLPIYPELTHGTAGRGGGGGEILLRALIHMSKRALLEKIERREAVVGIIGLGYVGLPLAVEFAKAGLRVVGLRRERACGRAPESRGVAHPGRSGGARWPPW